MCCGFVGGTLLLSSPYVTETTLELMATPKDSYVRAT